MSSILEKDVKRLAKFCERLHYTNSSEPFENHLFVILNNAMPSVHFTVDCYQIEPFRFTKMLTDTVPEKTFETSKSFMHQHPGHATDGPPPVVGALLTTGDTAAFKKTELCNDIFRPINIKDQIWMSATHKNQLIGTVFSRDTSFTSYDQTLFSLIQPHVNLAWKNWSRTRKLEQQLELLNEKNIISEQTAKQSAKIKQTINSLTKRQQQVTELISTGKNNIEIALELGISPRTVGKHLENIFETIHVQTRTELAAKWHQTH